MQTATIARSFVGQSALIDSRLARETHQNESVPTQSGQANWLDKPQAAAAATRVNHVPEQRFPRSLCYLPYSAADANRLH